MHIHTLQTQKTCLAFFPHQMTNMNETLDCIPTRWFNKYETIARIFFIVCRRAKMKKARETTKKKSTKWLFRISSIVVCSAVVSRRNGPCSEATFNH